MQKQDLFIYSNPLIKINVNFRSKCGVKALTLIIEKIPEAMDILLSRAVSVEKYHPTNVKCELKLDFG